MTNPYFNIPTSRSQQSNPYAGIPTTRSGNDLTLDELDDEDERPGVLQRLWNPIRFVGSVFATEAEKELDTLRESGYGAMVKQDLANVSRLGEVASAVGSRIKKTLTTRPSISGIGGAAKEALMEAMNPVNAVESFEKMLIETPLAAITPYKNENGKAVPSSPDEQAQAVLQTVGNMVMTKLGTKVGAALGTKPSVAGIQASGLMKAGALARNIGASMTGMGVGAIPGGIIGELGEDDYLTKVAVNAIAGAPLGLVFGALQHRSLGKATKALEGEIRTDSRRNALEAAGLAGLRASERESLSDIIKKVDAFKSSGTALQAFVKSRLSAGKGIIVDGITQDELAAVLGEMKRTDNPVKPQIVSSGLAKIRKMDGTTVEFDDPYDHGAYIVAKKLRGHEQVAEKLKATGVTLPEIESHGLSVDAKIKEEIKGGKVRPKNQAELDAREEFTRRRGVQNLNKMLDGEVITDYTGKQWKKQGDVVTDGSTTYPVDSFELHKILGRSKSDMNANSGVLKLGPQQYLPEFGRDIKGFKVYIGPNDTTLIRPATDALDYGQQAYFERTGFLPGEIVVGKNGDLVRVEEVSNSKGKITVTPLGGGREQIMDINNVRRETSSALPRSVSGGQGFITGKLTGESYFDSLYKEVKNNMKTESEPYERVLLRAMNTYNIPQDAQLHVEQAIYKRIQTEVANANPKESEILNKIRVGAEALNNMHAEDWAHSLNSAADAAGMYIKSVGGGQYELRFFDGDKLMTKAGSLGELQNALHVMQQQPGVELVGAGGAIPPGAVKTTAMGKGGGSRPFTKSEKFQTGLAHSILVNITPPLNLAESFGSRFKRNGIDNTIFPSVLKMQRALEGHKKWMKESTITRAVDDYNNAVSAAKGLSVDKLMRISDYMETMSPEEVRTSFLSRSLNDGEVQMAQFVAQNAPVSEVKSFLADVRKKAGTAGFMTPEYIKALMVVKANYSPEVASVAQSILKTSKQTGVDNFSTLGVMKYADAIQTPDLHLTKSEFAARHKLSAQELEVAGHLMKALDKGFETFGISPQQRIGAYVPHLAMAEQLGSPHPGNLPEAFTSQFTRFNVDNNGPRRNALELVNSYLRDGSKVASGFFSEVKNAKDALVADFDKVLALPESDQRRANLVNAASGAKRLFEDYEAHVRSIADYDERLYRSLKGASDTLGWAPSSDSMMAIASMSIMGMRPKFGIRDAYHFMHATASYFDFDIAKDALARGRGAQYRKALTHLPDVEPIDMMLPDVNPSNIGKLIETGSKLGFWVTLQHQVYQRALAGLYGAFRDRTLTTLGEYERGALTKMQAEERLHLDLYSESVKDYFWSLKDSPQKAGDFVGRWQGKTIMNNFGNANNPVGLQTKFGRFLGMYGSWQMNAARAYTDMLTNGRPERRIWRATKLHGMDLLVATGLGAAGFQAANIIYVPFSLIGLSNPIVSGGQEVVEGLQYIMNGDTERGLGVLARQLPPTTLDDVKRWYIPYSYALQDYINSYNEKNPFEAILGLKLSK